MASIEIDIPEIQTLLNAEKNARFNDNIEECTLITMKIVF